FLLLILPPARSTLFPYTTLFRSSLTVTADINTTVLTEKLHMAETLLGSGYQPEIETVERPEAMILPPSEAKGNPTKQRMHEQQKDRKSTRLNSSHVKISYAVFCL